MQVDRIATWLRNSNERHLGGTPITGRAAAHGRPGVINTAPPPAVSGFEFTPTSSPRKSGRPPCPLHSAHDTVLMPMWLGIGAWLEFQTEPRWRPCDRDDRSARSAVLVWPVGALKRRFWYTCMCIAIKLQGIFWTIMLDPMFGEAASKHTAYLLHKYEGVRTRSRCLCSYSDSDMRVVSGLVMPQ